MKFWTYGQDFTAARLTPIRNDTRFLVSAAHAIATAESNFKPVSRYKYKSPCSQTRTARFMFASIPLRLTPTFSLLAETSGSGSLPITSMRI